MYFFLLKKLVYLEVIYLHHVPSFFTSKFYTWHFSLPLDHPTCLGWITLQNLFFTIPQLYINKQLLPQQSVSLSTLKTAFSFSLLFPKKHFFLFKCLIKELTDYPKWLTTTER